MTETIKVEGLEELTAGFAGLEKSLKQYLRAALVSIGNDVKSVMVRSITSQPKSGKVYKRRSVSHRASAAGEAPANDTGRLAGSIGVFPDLEKLETEIGIKRPMVEYAAYLEFGTSRMDERPFVAPAGKQTREKNYQKIKKAVALGIKNAK